MSEVTVLTHRLSKGEVAIAELAWCRKELHRLHLIVQHDLATPAAGWARAAKVGIAGMAKIMDRMALLCEIAAQSEEIVGTVRAPAGGVKAGDPVYTYSTADWYPGFRPSGVHDDTMDAARPDVRISPQVSEQMYDWKVDQIAWFKHLIRNCGRTEEEAMRIVLENK